MTNQFTTIDEYIGTFPEDVQAVLEKIRQTIHKLVPDATEAISYGIPCFKMDGHYLVYFAGYKHHVGLYPLPRGNAALQKLIAPYVHGKGTARFSLSDPIPYNVISKLVQAHLKDHQEK